LENIITVVEDINYYKYKNKLWYRRATLER
jgi:hypothetical protein